MSRICLDPVHHQDHHTDWVADELVAYLEDVVFSPVLDILSDDGVRVNARETDSEHRVIHDAIMAGVIWYLDGVFTGEFNAAISRELRSLGARKIPSGFALDKGQIPLPLRSAINRSAQRSEQLHKALIDTLTTIAAFAAEAPTGISLTNTVDKIASEIQEQFAETVARTDKLPPVSRFPAGGKDRLAAKAERAANEAIRNFTITLAQDLRAKIRENLLAGARVDRLVKIVESVQNAAKRRARGIAEHEVAVFIAGLREMSALVLGASRYVWVTRHDERVRHDHRILDGKVFSWDDPPVTNQATGARNHPGGDHNCRCVPRPVITLA